MNAPLMFESAGDERGTPQKFFDELNAEFHFDLDAAANRENHKCELYMGPGGVEEDALTADWGGAGITVFHNPPYSLAQRFIEKAKAEAAKGCTVVNLLPVRSDTKWWHRHIWDKDAWAPNIEHSDGDIPDGHWRPGVRGRLLPGRLEFELKVPADLRAWIQSEYLSVTSEQGETNSHFTAQVRDDWFKSMSKVTGLPRMAVERILQGKPDSDLLDSAPFPSCVVIFEQVAGGNSKTT